MHKLKKFLFLLFIFNLGCSSNNSEVPEPSPVTQPSVSVNGSTLFENANSGRLQFEIRASETLTNAVSVTYTISGVTAEPDKDFMGSTGTIEIPVGSNSASIAVPIIDDEVNEINEKLMITLTEATNATINTATAIGIIQDDDEPTYTEDGYETAMSHFGYELEWSDEFDGTALDTDVFNYDLGDGCPDLCGWGNNELVVYTDEPEHIWLTDGQLVIQATKEGSSNFKAAKIHTKGKQAFQFGRIDIRAKMPEGQGIWPAIWMLGQNIDAVGWPACGEIDIMELVGHTPKITHGTAHWGPQGGPNKSSGASFSLDEKFSERFHVFSLVWERDEMLWYMDEILMHKVTVSSTQGDLYPFNQAFYLIFNIAIGGNWPGNPDETTVFPQQMVVDYVRYFK